MSHYRKHYPKNSKAKAPENATAEVQMPELAPAEHDLMVSLFRELFQTEQSARLHPQREADRLGDVPPASALREVSTHAEGVLKALPALAEKNNLPISMAGMALGNFLSATRQLIIDRVVEPERSYRGTLSGMRHGVDVVETIRHAAHAQHNKDLETWCTEWLNKRTHLVKMVAKELEWFARTPEAAMGQPLQARLMSGLTSVLRKKSASVVSEMKAKVGAKSGGDSKPELNSEAQPQSASQVDGVPRSQLA